MDGNGALAVRLDELRARLVARIVLILCRDGADRRRGMRQHLVEAMVAWDVSLIRFHWQIGEHQVFAFTSEFFLFASDS